MGCGRGAASVVLARCGEGTHGLFTILASPCFGEGIGGWCGDGVKAVCLKGKLSLASACPLKFV